MWPLKEGARNLDYHDLPHHACYVHQIVSIEKKYVFSWKVNFYFLKHKFTANKHINPVTEELHTFRPEKCN